MSAAGWDFYIKEWWHYQLFNSKKYKINPGDKPPPVFSNFDVVQKNYFKELNSKDLTDKLPDGKFMNTNDLPGLIISDILEDNDGRKFQ